MHLQALRNGSAATEMPFLGCEWMDRADLQQGRRPPIMRALETSSSAHQPLPAGQNGIPVVDLTTPPSR
jgi:hypothetical protein